VWWQYIIIAAVLVLGIYAFLVFTGFETRTLSRRTTRTAEDMYPSYADSLRKQRRYARQTRTSKSAGSPGTPSDSTDRGTVTGRPG
jgi:hypothetical protein